jgi:hypothetical protein
LSDSTRLASLVAGVLILFSLRPAAAAGQAVADEARPDSSPASAFTLDELPASVPASARVSVGEALASEARRYVKDTADILVSPIHWDRRTWLEAAAGAAAIAVISHEDSTIQGGVQRSRSSTTNSISRAVTPLGSTVGVGLSIAALGGGLVFRDTPLRDLGRDAVEAELISGGIVTPLMKWTLGRTRPSQGGDADEYKPFSTSQSFPSGHTTEAFTLASVVATRSQGWVVPTVAYGLAAAVGFARMNDQAHYASDVVTGAVIGTLVGRSVVHRHAEGPEKQASWTVIPFAAHHGAGLAVHIETGAR